jgi:hypothetical protein
VKPKETTALCGNSEMAQREMMFPRHSEGPCMQWTSLSPTTLMHGEGVRFMFDVALEKRKISARWRSGGITKEKEVMLRPRM